MTESSIPQGDNKVTPSLQQWLDWLSKAWVPLLAAIYGGGYVIVSIYYASLGLNAISLFRPQVAAAGCMFLAIGAGALSWMHVISSTVMRLEPATTAFRRYLFAGCFGWLYLFCFDFMMAIVLQKPILHFEEPQPNLGMFVLIASTAFAVCLVALVSKSRSKRWVSHWVALLCFGLTLATLLWMSIPHHRPFGPGQFAFYLFLIQISSLAVRKALAALDQVSSHNWWYTVVELLIPLVVYSLGIYPHVRQPFGGGNPTSGQIFLTTAIGNDPVKQFTATIIDETDSGFYVIQSNQKNVCYVPRSVISSIEFNEPTGYF